MKLLEKKIRTYPLFVVFIVLFCISFLFTKLTLLNNNRNKDKVILEGLSGEISRLSWNKSSDFVFFCEDEYGKNYRILIKGSSLSDDERTEILEKGFVSVSSLKLIIPEISSNKGEFDYAAYLKAKNVDYYAYAYSDTFEITEKNKEIHSLNFYSSRLRALFSDSLYKYFDEDFASIILAIMTGDTGFMDEEEKENISLSGFSHLVAVSGAHIVFLTKPFAIVFKRTTLSSGKRKLIMIIPVLFIWFMAGGSPSVTRAMIMTLFSSVSVLFRKHSSTINSIGLAGLIQLIINPSSCLDTGFLLSYGASISLGIILPWLKSLLNTKNSFVNMLLPGLAVNIGILPISTSIFGSFSICGFLLNVFAGEIAGILCVGGYLIVLLDRLMSFFPIKQGAAVFTSLAYIFEKITSFISGEDSWFFKMEISLIPVVLIVVYYFLLCFLISKRKPKVLLAISVLLVAWFIYSQSITKITVSFLDVGQGSCQLIETCDGVKGLVDTGNGDKDVAELLKRVGIEKLDFIIITHGHDDHYGGLEGILEEIEVSRLFVPSNIYDTYCNNLSERGDISVVKIYGESSYSLGKYSIIRMYESENDYSDLNNGSILSIISGNWGAVMLPGDSETEFMDELLARNVDVSSDVYLAAHHGSKTSVNEKFLCDVSPKYAIISAGYENSYGHPSELFLNQLSSMGLSDSRIFRTDVSGEIVLKCGVDFFGKDFVRVWQKKPIPA